jgi:hypothetical protein
MANLIFYFWLIILIVYILIPFDLHPHLFDDLIALGVLFYLWYRHAKQKRPKDYSYTYTYSQSQENKQNRSGGNLDLREAYKILGVNPDAPWNEIKKSYKSKIAKTHPDKVSHLSEELQEKARELTLKLNSAFDMIKHSKKK